MHVLTQKKLPTRNWFTKKTKYIHIEIWPSIDDRDPNQRSECIHWFIKMSEKVSQMLR